MITLPCILILLYSFFVEENDHISDIIVTMVMVIFFKLAYTKIKNDITVTSVIIVIYYDYHVYSKNNNRGIDGDKDMFLQTQVIQNKCSNGH